MKILRGLSTNRTQPATQPFPASSGFFFELRGGDILHPWGKGEWFKPPYFASIWRAWCAWCVLPFLSWRFGTIGGYVGFKVYGADSEAYRHWMPEGDVYEGSQALQMSARLWATLSP